MDEVSPSSSAELLAVRLLAEYFQNTSKRYVVSLSLAVNDVPTSSTSTCRENIVKQVEAKLTSGVDAGNDTFILIAANIYYHEKVGVVITSLLHRSTLCVDMYNRILSRPCVA